MWYGPRPVNALARSRATRVAGVLAAVAAALCTGVGTANPAPGGPSAASLERAERSTLLELYAVESALARARRSADAFARRERVARTRETAAARHVLFVGRSLARTRARATQTLRSLYMEGDRSDPIAVILGAESLEAALDGLDGLEHVARRHQQLTRELVRTEAALVRTAAAARRERLAAERARVAAASAVERLARVDADRTATLARIRARRASTAARVTRLERAAREAVTRAAALERPAPAPAPSTVDTPDATAAPAAATPVGTRTLVVDAVAYHLPGRTASGIPVGIGVIAVDPSVIPLGTRVFVPGYGAAVAADVGSAVKGNIIDLWMPTTAQARAWGRRTVTITIYG